MSAEVILLYSLALLFFILLFFFLVRSLVLQSRMRKDRPAQEPSQVGFVVDTFHELVSQLKEKERELENLREKAESRATAIEGYNEDILQSVPSGVISFDEELRITKVNRAAQKILEIEGETVGKLHSEVFARPLTDFLEKGKTVERGEISYTVSSGRRIYLGLAISPLKDREGAVIGLILVFTDLTHLKAIESQMELRNRLSSLGELSAGIAHELRNPMGVIAGYTKILAKKTDASFRPTVDAISREIVVMNRIISDFLSFARPVDLAASSVNLNTFIEQCISSAVGEREDIHLEVDADGVTSVRGDEILLRQALTNLLQNAVEAMPQGGGLKITASHPDENDATAEITIADTGHGIPEGIEDKIFLPFFTTKEKGTGLGLAIVHKIVVSHGGTISVESSAKGTKFIIRLP